MADFFFHYGLFALETLTVAGAVAAIVILIVSMVSRSAEHRPDELEIEKLNERYKRESEALSLALLDDAAYRHHEKQQKAERKKTAKDRKRALSKKGEPESDAPERPRVYVLDFEGDLQAHAVSSLRREITAVLSVARKTDEVLIRLESGGGLVHAYGLAASQLQRIKTAGVPLTVCVDKVAASGGYMMACVSDRLLAAPFAIIGSIGVVAQLPNFHRLLNKHDVDFELHTAGRYKRTLTLFGENTPEGRKKFQEEIEDTHELFKEFVAGARPIVDVEKVATGEIWFGQRALSEKLIDELSTSDEYIGRRTEEADVLSIRFVKKKSIQDKLTAAFEGAADRVFTRVWQKVTERPISS